MASHYYLEGGFQLGRRSREQKLDNDAEWNEVPQGRTAGHVLARLEEQWSERGRSRVTSHWSILKEVIWWKNQNSILVD